MKATYTEAFVEQALVKVLSRGQRTVRAVAEELNVSYFTLKNWMKKISVKKRRSAIEGREKRPQDWSAEEQLGALHESHALEGEALQGWCRERGLFAHHLVGWKEAFCAGGKPTHAAVGGELRTLKEENQHLKRELLRKEKALAEAAALLILQKKFQALWADEVK
jgi:transposase-like protein